jgi:hypothetical protein
MKSDKRKRKKSVSGNAFAFIALEVLKASIRANFPPVQPIKPVDDIEDIPYEDVTDPKK